MQWNIYVLSKVDKEDYLNAHNDYIITCVYTGEAEQQQPNNIDHQMLVWARATKLCVFVQSSRGQKSGTVKLYMKMIFYQLWSSCDQLVR